MAASSASDVRMGVQYHCTSRASTDASPSGLGRRIAPVRGCDGALPLDTGGVLVIPERVYLAGLKLGKVLRRRDAETRRAETASSRQAKAAREHVVGLG